VCPKYYKYIYKVCPEYYISIYIKVCPKYLYDPLDPHGLVWTSEGGGSPPGSTDTILGNLSKGEGDPPPPI
jgi:hypothetical protein